MCIPISPSSSALGSANHALGSEPDVGTHVLLSEACKFAVPLAAVIFEERQGAPRIGLEGEFVVSPVVAMITAQVELVRGSAVANVVAVGDG